MEDKISSLCEQILLARDGEEVGPKLIELRDALHRYIERLRVRLAQYPVVSERRIRNGASAKPRVDNG
jgi:hypothetical protein